MKRPSLIAMMAVGAALCACARMPTANAPTTAASAEYEATGDTSGIRAFVYGKRTVLELPSRPLRLSIQDENGVAVPYEREGQYYRLPRTLERFTVWANTRVLAFKATRMQALHASIDANSVDRITVATPAADALSSVKSPVTTDTAPPSDDAAIALLRISTAQLDEARHAIATGAGCAAETKILMARLDRIEARLVSAATAMVRVQFDTASTEFAADKQLIHALIPAAKAAQRINIRGRTDAQNAGRNDARIALGRALAVRRFLVENDVEGDKIHVFALAAGRFIAPVASLEGRALNRRVEIELVNQRYAQLALQARQQQGAAP